jgi:short-subunit dehydrogenase
MQGKHILITGASRGLGRSIAQKLHAAGAQVSLTARSFNDLQIIKKDLGDRVEVYGADLNDKTQRNAMLKYIREKSGPVFGLVNNAGSGWYRPFDAFSEEENETMIDLNFRSLVALTREVLPDMKQNSGGSILNVASDLARRPMPNMAVYTATKHALAGFSHSLTRELKQFNIKVQMILPGMIDTDFGDGKAGDNGPPNVLDPNDVADIVVFMMSRPSYLLMDEVHIHPVNQDF